MILTPPTTSRVLEYLLATLRLGVRAGLSITLESFGFPVLEMMDTAFVAVPAAAIEPVEEVGGAAVYGAVHATRRMQRVPRRGRPVPG